MASIVTKGYGANQRIILQGYGVIGEVIIIVTPPPKGVYRPPRIVVKRIQKVVNVYSDVSIPVFYTEEVKGSTIIHIVTEAKVWGNTVYKVATNAIILGDLIDSFETMMKITGDYIFKISTGIVVTADTIQSIALSVVVTGKKGFKKFMELLIEDE